CFVLLDDFLIMAFSSERLGHDQVRNCKLLVVFKRWHSASIGNSEVGFIDLRGAAEGLHGTLTILQLNVSEREIIQCLCVLWKESNGFLEMSLGIFPVLLVHLLRSQLEFLLGSVRNDWRNR